MDNNDKLTTTAGATDQITERSICYDYDDDLEAWWTVEEDHVLTDAATSGATRATSVTRTRFGGQELDEIVSESRYTGSDDHDPNAPDVITSRTLVYIDRALKRRVSDTEITGITAHHVSVSRNGRLVKSQVPGRGVTSYHYDSFGRPTGSTDPQTGLTSLTTYNAAGQVATVRSDATKPGADATYDYYTTNPPLASYYGRLKSVTNADNRATHYNYDALGNIEAVFGISNNDSAVYPVSYTYDDFGELETMATHRDGGSVSDFGTYLRFSAGANASITTWHRDPGSGALLRKEDAATKSVKYNYDGEGRLDKKTNARGQVADYSFYDDGSLAIIDHIGDHAQDLSFTYSRAGRLATVTDVAGTRTFQHSAGGSVTSEALAGNFYGAALTLTNTYGGIAGQRDSFTGQLGASQISRDYTYRPATGQLETVTAGNLRANYRYLPHAPVVNSVTLSDGGVTKLTGRYLPDAKGQLGTVRYEAANPAPGTPAVISSYTYTYNDLGQRTSAELADGTSWSYQYNNRGEVATASKIYDNGFVPGMRYSYTYDMIGNRTAAYSGGDKDGNNLRTTSYFADANQTAGANELNQYKEISNPREFSVVGRAADPALVEINDTTPAAADRRDPFFRVELTAAGTGATLQDVICEENNAQIDTGTRYIPPATESLTYDADGNLASNGRWAYTWDADNRLVSMESHAALDPDIPRTKLEFTYDYAGRRIEKTVSTGWDGNSYATSTTQRFVYDGWNLVARLDGNGAAEQTYTWGLDLSGSEQGAGGVGGLLWITDGSETHFASFDGNGNVAGLFQSSSDTASATYEYGAFGNAVRRSGSFALGNPFRFSAKYEDAESGLLYYGYRYYDPSAGRWLNRDPAGERGGQNLYGFVGNDGVNRWDVLGLWKLERKSSESRASAISQKGDTVRDLARMVRLQPEEYRKWLERRGGKLNIFLPLPKSLDEPLEADCNYTVPNEMVGLLGPELGKTRFGGKLSKNIFLTAMLAMMEDFRGRMESGGYKYTRGGSLMGISMRAAIGSRDTAGILVVSHGAGGLLGSSDSGEEVIKPEDFIEFEMVRDPVTGKINGVDRAERLHHRLELMVLVACQAGARRLPQTSPVGILLSPGWQSFVSDYGTLYSRGGNCSVFGDIDGKLEAHPGSQAGSSPSLPFIPR